MIVLIFFNLVFLNFCPVFFYLFADFILCDLLSCKLKNKFFFYSSFSSRCFLWLFCFFSSFFFYRYSFFIFYRCSSFFFYRCGSFFCFYRFCGFNSFCFFFYNFFVTAAAAFFFACLRFAIIIFLLMNEKNILFLLFSKQFVLIIYHFLQFINYKFRLHRSLYIYFFKIWLKRTYSSPSG